MDHADHGVHGPGIQKAKLLKTRMEQPIGGNVMRIVRTAFSIITGEAVLKCVANGGAVVLARSIIVAIELFAMALMLLYFTGHNAVISFRPEPSIIRGIIHKHINWLGAIWGACYLSFYSRYSSQWIYLADLYNKIMRAEAEKLNVDMWWAAFVEDAWTLHLARKPMFCHCISTLRKRGKVMGLVRTSLGDKEYGRLIYVIRNFERARALA